MVVLSEDLAKPIVGTAKVGIADDAGAGAVSACSRLQDRRIADLPGYGYAKVPLKMRNHWKTIMANYFASRECLRGVVLVMDIRHPMKPFDEQMIAWCDSAGLSCHILLTKADKLKRGPATSTLLKVRKALPESASVQVFSAKSRVGLEDLLTVLLAWFDYAKDKDSQPRVL